MLYRWKNYKQDDIQTLINSLVFYSVVASQILALTYALRENPDQSASILFDESEVILPLYVMLS